jgi:phage terminase small subunit
VTDNVVALNGGGAAPPVAPVQPPSSGIKAERPRVLAKLSPLERRIFNHLARELERYGLAHRTDAMLLIVIARVFCQWVDAEERLQQHIVATGTMMAKTPNGYEQPHQLYYVAKDLKKQLLAWLPEAALTIPSFAKLTGDDQVPATPDMFEDPVVDFRNRKRALSGTSSSQG